MSVNDKQIGGSHYKSDVIQPWDYIHRNKIGYLAGNVIKYVTRFDKKNGIEDLYKAHHYIEKLINEHNREEEAQFQEEIAAARARDGV